MVQTPLSARRLAPVTEGGIAAVRDWGGRRGSAYDRRSHDEDNEQGRPDGVHFLLLVVLGRFALGVDLQERAYVEENQSIERGESL